MDYQPHFTEENLKFRARLSILSTVMQIGGDREPGHQACVADHWLSLQTLWSQGMAVCQESPTSPWHWPHKAFSLSCVDFITGGQGLNSLTRILQSLCPPLLWLGKWLTDWTRQQQHLSWGPDTFFSRAHLISEPRPSLCSWDRQRFGSKVMAEGLLWSQTSNLSSGGQHGLRAGHGVGFTD